MTALSLAPERFADLPAWWSASARETYAQIEEEHALGPIEAATLFEACALLAFADDAEALVRRDGLTSVGSMGQPTAHPLVAEVRQFRREALAALRALGLARGQSSASAAGAALAAKRHTGRGRVV